MVSLRAVGNRRGTWARRCVPVAVVVASVSGFAGRALAAPFAFVANNGSGNISQYGGASGGLSALSPKLVSAGKSPFGMAASPDGKSVYATNTHGNKLWEFSVNRTTGTLTVTGKLEAGQGPRWVAVSPDSRSVYVTNTSANTVSQYSFDRTGALRVKASPVKAGSDPAGVAVSPDGKSVYVANEVDGTVSQYTADQTGTLSPAATTAKPGGCPCGVAVAPQGR